MNEKTKSILVLVAFILFIYAIFYFLQPDRFGGIDAMIMLLQQSFIPAVGACGYFFLFTIGFFDLSMGANIILSSLVGCLLSIRFGYSGLIFGCVITGALIGFINAAVTIKLKIPAVIATVGMLIIYECLGYFLTNFAGGTNMLTLPIKYRAFGRDPWNIILSALSFVILFVIYKYSKVGLYSNAIGTNKVLAKHAGINIEKYYLVTSIIGGVFLGVTGILTISYGSTLSPVLNMESFKRGLAPTMGCFLGVAMKKYVNPVIVIILGEFLFSLIMNGLVTNGIDATIQNVVQGTVLLIIVCLTMHSDRFSEVK